MGRRAFRGSSTDAIRRTTRSGIPRPKGLWRLDTSTVSRWIAAGIAGSLRIKRSGRTGAGIARYKCNECGRTFTVLTGTGFDQRKIPLSERLDFLLSIFGYVCFNLTSRMNRNAYNTTRYWIRNLFALLDGSQDGTVLEGRIYYDETYYSVKRRDRRVDEDGHFLTGFSKDKYCIGVATDGTNVV